MRIKKRIIGSYLLRGLFIANFDCVSKNIYIPFYVSLKKENLSGIKVKCIVVSCDILLIT